MAGSAHTTRDSETGNTELHADDIETFRDLGLDLPFEYGDAIYDTKRDIVRIPVAIGPSDNGGFSVYCYTFEVREPNYRDELRVKDLGAAGPNNISMKLLLTLMEADTCKIIDKSRVKA